MAWELLRLSVDVPVPGAPGAVGPVGPVGPVGVVTGAAYRPAGSPPRLPAPRTGEDAGVPGLLEGLVADGWQVAGAEAGTLVLARPRG